MCTPSLQQQKETPPAARRRVSLLRIGRIVLVVGFVLEALTASILMLIAAFRNRRKRVPVFSHFRLDEVQVGDNRLQLYCYGRDLYDDMLAAIDNAQECIYLESYIWKDDAAGWEFKTRLTKKAAEGVAVYVIFDSFGNLVVPSAFKIFDLRVHVLEYRSLQHIWQCVDPRRYSLDHRKLLIIDGHTSFIGGYNIGSLYETAWRDTHVRIEGPASADLAHAFVDFWNRFCPREHAIKRSYPRKFDAFVNVHANDAMHLTFPIRDLYIEAINRSERSILLSNAYFMPDHILLNALKAAARRGVDVRVLVPWNSNHVVADWIAHGYFADCLHAGIHVLGYRPAMLHAKTCTIDGAWSTVGTANLDRLSSIGNYEINVEIYSAEFAQQMENSLPVIQLMCWN